jgi:hypothetical protein
MVMCFVLMSRLLEDCSWSQLGCWWGSRKGWCQVHGSSSGGHQSSCRWQHKQHQLQRQRDTQQQVRLFGVLLAAVRFAG